MFGIYSLERAIAFASLKVSSRYPRTFNEKIKLKAALDRRPILRVFADKFEMRNYVGAVVGSSYLPHLYAWGTDFNAVDFNYLPNDFVFKVNHGSGGVVIVWGGSRSNEFLPGDPSKVSWTSYEVNPSNLQQLRLVALGNHWLGMDYYHFKGCNRMPEWAYKGIGRKFLFEELLLEDSRTLAMDYKFHMFNGRCEFINVIRRNVFNPQSGRRETTSDIFSSEWVPMAFELNGLRRSGSLIPKPKGLEEMIHISEKLAGGIDYLRVDLYYPAGKKILVGELTNYPMAAQMKFNPPALNLEFGQKLTLDTGQYRRI